MNQEIVLNFPPGITGDAKLRFKQAINQKLGSIQREVNNWNAFIELRPSPNNEYQLVAICDDDDLREKMQELLAS